MTSRIEVAEVLASPQVGETVTVMGWVRAFRSNRFIALNDGSTMNNLQVVVDYENLEEELRNKIKFHACVRATGQLVESQGSGQAVEVQAREIEIIGETDPDTYPLQPKRQTMEYLREKAHFPDADQHI